MISKYILARSYQNTLIIKDKYEVLTLNLYFYREENSWKYLQNKAKFYFCPIDAPFSYFPTKLECKSKQSFKEIARICNSNNNDLNATTSVPFHSFVPSSKRKRQHKIPADLTKNDANRHFNWKSGPNVLLLYFYFCYSL